MPGRYQHNQDPIPATLLHQVTLDGWGNNTVGDLEEDGVHASLLIVEPAEQQVLTDAFNQPIPVGNWILTEDQHGWVTLAQYPTPQATRNAFTNLPDPYVPGEGDRGDHPSQAAGPANTRSPSAVASSATPPTSTRPPRCCATPWTPTAPGRMPGQQRPRQPPPPPAALSGRGLSSTGSLQDQIRPPLFPRSPHGRFHQAKPLGSGRQIEVSSHPHHTQPAVPPTSPLHRHHPTGVPMAS